MKWKEFIIAVAAVVTDMSCAKFMILVLLLVAAYQDIKDMSISRTLVFFGMAFSIIFRFLTKPQLFDILIDVVISLVFILFSYISRELLGYGDSLIFTILFLALSFRNGVRILITGLIINACFVGGLWIFGKKRLKDSVPFLPSMLIAYIIFLLEKFIR